MPTQVCSESSHSCCKILSNRRRHYYKRSTWDPLLLAVRTNARTMPSTQNGCMKRSRQAISYGENNLFKDGAFFGYFLVHSQVQHAPHTNFTRFSIRQWHLARSDWIHRHIGHRCLSGKALDQRFDLLTRLEKTIAASAKYETKLKWDLKAKAETNWTCLRSTVDRHK